MTQNEGLDSRRLTFSQAQGYEELPGPLKLEEISDDARIRLWDLLFSSAWQAFSGVGWIWRRNTQWPRVFEALHRDFLKLTRDDFLKLQGGPFDQGTKLIEQYRQLILYELPFNKIFDLFQMIMRHKDCPLRFKSNVAGIFEECRLAYMVDTKNPVIILPAATTQEGEAIVGAIKEFREAGLNGAAAQLRKAGEIINQADWPGAIRESIHAVESVARQLDPDASKTLDPALKSLEKGGRLHPALKEAFSKLYGYTSNEEGIRHALLHNATSPAGRDEAVFMLGACASFASYLWHRSRQGS